MSSVLKATNEELVSEYEKLGSVWAVAKVFGMCGQSVHERLQKIGKTRNKFITPREARKIQLLYSKGFEVGDGKLNALCIELGRTKAVVCRWAGKRGLTNVGRKICETRKAKQGEFIKQHFKEVGHPRGMLGKHHTEEMKAGMKIKSKNAWARKSESEKSDINLKGLKTKYEKYGYMAPLSKRGSWKAAWRVIGGKRKFYRSKWEANYARYLEFLKLNGEIDEWDHEPRAFWFEKIKRGVRSYLPDFSVMENGREYYIEVKGWMDSRSRTKLNRMRIYHPEIDLRLVDSKAYRALSKQVSGVVEGWE